MTMLIHNPAYPLRRFTQLRAWCALMLAMFLSPKILPAQASSEATRLFAEANQAYEQGRFDDAVRSGEQIAQYGIHNAAVYYNLGNAYFKQNRLGKAILFYEKARRLDPGDRDTNENLAFVNALRIDRIEESEPPFWFALLSRIHNLWPLDTQLWALALLWVLANIGLGLRLTRRETLLRRAGTTVAIAALLLLIPGALSATVRIHDFSQQEGVIVADKADVLSGPAEGNAVLASVHEGLKVEIRSEASGWLQVILPNGLNGWVPQAALGRI
jgi:tetratricopeptide (TPR) repeat protein